MDLDTLADRERRLRLFELYGGVLNQHQFRILSLNLAQDWSLAEIATAEGTSRAAVHEVLQRAQNTLAEHERALGLLAAEEGRRRTRTRVLRELGQIRRRVDQLETLLGTL
ncbi:MAG TPA: transcriptional regulator [Candidatus Nitrosotalea sp.]|nr:transcriptional regulator [Candidatus Nitrosotalea sp.]